MRTFIKEVNYNLERIITQVVKEEHVPVVLNSIVHPEDFPEVEFKWDILIDEKGTCDEQQVLRVRDKLMHDMMHLGFKGLSVCDYEEENEEGTTVYYVVVDYTYEANIKYYFKNEIEYLKESNVNAGSISEQYKLFKKEPKWGVWQSVSFEWKTDYTSSWCSLQYLISDYIKIKN